MKMRIARTFWGIGALLVLASSVAWGQRPFPTESGSPMQNSAQTADRVSEAPPGEVIREIDDPHTGDRWLLMRDLRHPGGPGLLLLANLVGAAAKKIKPESNIPLPIIHAGDRVIVEESTPVIEARLEAVALSPAVADSVLSLRLVLGGKVVRAIATGPNRAMYVGEAQR